jgi:hypothetical protein
VRVARMLMAVVAVSRARSARFAQHDGELPVLGREHVACGHECPQAEHHQDEQRTASPRATTWRPIGSWGHDAENNARDGPLRPVVFIGL